MFFIFIHIKETYLVKHEMDRVKKKCFVSSTPKNTFTTVSNRQGDDMKINENNLIKISSETFRLQFKPRQIHGNAFSASTCLKNRQIFHAVFF